MKLKKETSPSRKAAIWGRHILNWKNSGITQKAYCFENKLNLSTFHYWRKKFSDQPQKTSLLPVQVIQEELATRNSGVSLILKSGEHIQVEENFNPRVLKQLICALEKR